MTIDVCRRWWRWPVGALALLGAYVLAETAANPDWVCYRLGLRWRYGGRR